MKGMWKAAVVGLSLVMSLVLVPLLCGQIFATNSHEKLSIAAADRSSSEMDLDIKMPESVNAVIYPFQSATIGTEARGIVDLINFKEGDCVERGAVVSEISKSRYEAIVGEFRGNYEAVSRTLERAREELAIQEETYDKRASTFDDLSKARSQMKVLEARKEEAEFKLKQAELNLKSCVLSAPFSGLIGVLYHQPYEAVENLEKVFELVDTRQVYARVNWPESRLSELELGKKATFQYAGTTWEGVIEKISSLIDPASKSKRVHVLIANPNGKMQVGMSGTLTLSSPSRVSLDMSGTVQSDTASH